MAYTTIDDPGLFFNTKLYTGTGSELALTGVGFQPDMVWIKRRNGARNHQLQDVVRGITKQLVPNETDAEATNTEKVKSIQSDGFTLGTNQDVNVSSDTFASWNWKAGTSFTNDASGTGIGDIDSSGSVNTTSGFSIITATSDGAANKNIAHGLGVVPDVIFAKNLASTFNWDCYFKTLGYNASLQINQTAAPRTGAWGSATFTSTTFQTSDSFSSANGQAYIYYCFAEKQGYSKVGGSYTGNGSSSDGTFVYLGFKPAFVMIKRTDSTGSWVLEDSIRSPSNSSMKVLFPNLSNAEETLDPYFDLLSNGFKTRSTSTFINASGATYIYMAFAENPFVTSTGIPTTAR